MQYSQHNQLLFIKSNHKIKSPEKGDFYQFGNPVTAKKRKRILAQLVEAEIPISYYTFNSVNNLISVTYEGDNSNATINFSFPDQVYNINDIVNKLNLVFNLATGSFTTLFTYDEKTFKMNLLVTAANNNSQVNKVKINPTTTCSSYLGLVVNQEQTGTSSSIRMIGENALNLNRTLNIYVKSSLKVENIDSRGVNDGTIAKIQVDVGPGEFIHYHNVENISFLINDSYVDHLTLTLEDDDSQVINFNGVQYHMTFAFRYVNETNDDYVPNLYDKVDDLQQKIDD